MVHVLPHWTWPGFEGKPIPVRVFTNADTVELFLNGKSLGSKNFPADCEHVIDEWTRKGHHETEPAPRVVRALSAGRVESGGEKRWPDGGDGY